MVVQVSPLESSDYTFVSNLSDPAGPTLDRNRHFGGPGIPTENRFLESYLEWCVLVPPLHPPFLPSTTSLTPCVPSRGVSTRDAGTRGDLPIRSSSSRTSLIFRQTLLDTNTDPQTVMNPITHTQTSTSLLLYILIDINLHSPRYQNKGRP